MDVETCSAGGYNVGWTNKGEWLEYTVTVRTTGNYDIRATIASPEGSSIHILLDGKNITGSMAIPATGGWQEWTTITRSDVALKAGNHVLQVFEEKSGFNIDKIEILQDSHSTSEAGHGHHQNDFRVYPNPDSRRSSN